MISMFQIAKDSFKLNVFSFLFLNLEINLFNTYLYTLQV